MTAMSGICFNAWDIALVLVVTGQAGILAYMHHPKWKALVLSTPIPFTLATLALDRPVDATNVIGFLNLILFINVVRWVYRDGAGVPIVAAIILAIVTYCGLGLVLASHLPEHGQAFWIACALTAAIAITAFAAMPRRDDPGHRSSLPVWIKMPIIALIVVGLVLIKQNLKGFIAAFPMVTIVGAYEARHSLWTMSRQIMLLTIMFMPALISMFLVQTVLAAHQVSMTVAIRWSLVVGWIVFLAQLIPITRHQWAKYADAEA